MEKIIEVTKKFRIVIKDNQYIVQQLYKIDPRNSPRFKYKEDGDIRYEWKDDGYYGLNENGLQAAIKSIIFMESKTRGNKQTNLKEYLNELKSITNQVFDTVESKINK